MNDLSTAPTHDRDQHSRPLAWLRGELDRLVEDVAAPTRDLLRNMTSFTTPAIDYCERDGAYRLTAELPGLTADDVRVTLVERTLILSGEKREEEARQGDGVMRRERRYGSFERRLPLPLDADEDAVAAAFANGVLTIDIPKGAEIPANGRRIDIRRAD